jgi:UDP-N-acetylmuramoyl-L-alanyl-D-glutamate--2,6-diaminopimelate ligase
MKLSQLIKGLEQSTITGKASIEVLGIAYDSRQVRPGFLFVAIPGHQSNGREFIADAIKRGAATVVSEGPLALGVGIAHVQVSDARMALALLSRDFYGNPARKMETFAVTGTNGKTTTSFMIRNILKMAARRPGLLGTVRYEIGDHWMPAARTTPESTDIHSMIARMGELGCESLVLEVSSHALIQKRVLGIEFDVGIFTNLTPEHLDYHKDMESYFSAKRLLFSMLENQKKRSVAVINIDCEWGTRLAQEIQGADVITYGFREGADVWATEAGLSESGSIFNVKSPWGEWTISIKQVGHYNVQNALAAFTACCSRGIPPETAISGLALLESVPGRLDRVINPKGLHVLIDYAHTADALANVLQALKQITKGRVIVVFGCGGNRDTAKRRDMGEVAAHFADYSVVTTDNPRKEVPSAIIEQIVEGFDSPSQFEVQEDREVAIARGLELIGPNDVLLLAGKGHENYQEFANTVIPFSDREVAERLLGM